MIAWQMDLQLPVQSCEFEPRSLRGVLDTTLCDKIYQRRPVFLRVLLFPPPINH
jgi:hypothetical protein